MEGNSRKPALSGLLISLSAPSAESPGDLASQEGGHSAAILHGDTYSYRKHSELWNNQPQDYQEPPHHQSQHCHPRHHQPQTHNCHSYHWPWKCHGSSHDQQHHHHHHHRNQPWILHQPPPHRTTSTPSKS